MFRPLPLELSQDMGWAGDFVRCNDLPVTGRSPIEQASDLEAGWNLSRLITIKIP